MDKDVVYFEDLLQITKDGWKYKGRKLSEQEVKNLKKEAEMLQNLFLYRVLIKEAKYHAAFEAIKTKPDELEKLQQRYEFIAFFEQFLSHIINK